MTIAALVDAAFSKHLTVSVRRVSRPGDRAGIYEMLGYADER
jgi:hypothetical protein